MIMWDSFLVAWQQPFFIRSLIVLVMLSLVFPLYGTLVTIRKQANIAHTFAHMWLLWIAAWLWFDVSIDVTIGGSVIVAILFVYLMWQYWSRSSKWSWPQSSDAINEIGAQLGLVWAVLIVSQMTGYQADLSSYLFGDILLLSQRDVWTISMVCVLGLAVYVLLRQSRYALSLNRDLALSKRSTCDRQWLLYLLMIGLLVAWAMKIIGVLLVSAFLILPSTIASLIARRTWWWIVRWISLSLVISLVALHLSWLLDSPTWATIVAVLLLVYLLVSVIVWLRK